jgi:hypothetical protein
MRLRNSVSMPKLVVKGRIASTHPVDKYPGGRLAAEALEGLAERLRTGDVPMLFDHDARQTIVADWTDAEVVPLDDGESALEVTFEIDAEVWAQVQDKFDDVGVVGGFSFTSTVSQVAPRSGRPAAVVLAADAAAWSDHDRAEAGALLDVVIPTQTDRLFQYSGVELATIFLVLAQEVSLGVLGNAAYDALRHLIGRRTEQTRIEIHRRDASGDVLKAVITTSDPDVAREALDTLRPAQPAPTLHFDSTTRRWLDH